MHDSRIRKLRAPALQVSRPIAIEIFAGIGGLSLGLEWAGFNVTAAIELDPIHSAVHRFNFPQTVLIQEDARRISSRTARTLAEQVLRETSHPIVDLVAGGPPCQGFSSGGIHDPEDDRNGLLLTFARLVGAIRPRYFMMENVPGLLGAKHQKTWLSLLRAFAKAGYDTGHPTILNASDFGVPQRRRRLFLYGWLRGEVPLLPPTGCHSPAVSVREAFSLLPDASKYPELYAQDILEYSSDRLLPRASKGNARFRFAQELRSTRSVDIYERAWNPEVLSGMSLTRHAERVLERFARTPPNGREPVSRYQRLSWSGQSPTLRSGTDRDHGSHTPPRPIHPHGGRVITVREAARLQSFPDWFTFHSTKWHAWRGIGNSVPPLLAEAVLRPIAERFDRYTLRAVRLPWADPTSLGYDSDWGPNTQSAADGSARNPSTRTRTRTRSAGAASKV